MGIINSIFGEQSKDSNAEKFPWQILESNETINDIKKKENNVSLIFKHSTRCSISRMALKQFENEFKNTNNIDCYFLDLIQYRDISNSIAEEFAVTHQSPQVLLIKKGKCIYNVSHSEIDAQIISNQVAD